MSMWRCPHCATPQAETARCWVCHKSSTTCSTCRNFRRSVAAQVGFCGLDRRRLPLAGTEHRGCWEAGSVPTADFASGTSPSVSSRRDRHNNRQFVPVELVGDPLDAAIPASTLGRVAAGTAAAGTAAAGTPSDLAAMDRWQDRVTLFGELDR